MTEADWLTATDPRPMLEYLRGKASDRKLRLFAVACCRRVISLLTDDRARLTLALLEQFADGRVGPVELAAAHPTVRAAVEDAFFEKYEAEAKANFCDRPAYSYASAVQAAVFAVGSLFDQTAGSAPPTADFSWAIGHGSHEHAASAVACEAEALTLWAYNRDKGWKDRNKFQRVVVRQVSRVEKEAQSTLLRDIFGNPFRPAAFESAWRYETVSALAAGIYLDRAYDRLPILADALEEAGCDQPDILNHCRGPGPHARGCWAVDLVLGKE